MAIKQPNPFDFSLEWLSKHLVGRTEEVKNIADLLQRGRVGLVSGPAGTGKSATVMRAAMEASRANGSVCVRLDFSHARSLAQTAEDVRTQLANCQKAGQRVSGQFIGELSTAATKAASAPLSEEAGMEAVGAVASLLGHLNAQRRNGPDPMLLVLDSVERLGNTKSLQAFCEEAAKFGQKGPIMLLLCARAEAAKNICANVPSIGGDASKRLTLPAMEKPVLAAWIDERLLAGGVASNSAGAACVDRANGNPAQAVDLAKRTFELSISARYANRGVVETAFKLTMMKKDGALKAAENVSKFAFDFSLSHTRDRRAQKL